MIFTMLVHADWSVAPRKRWAAVARMHSAEWLIERVGPVGLVDEFRRSLLGATVDGSVLAGFDFPIGVPAVYGRRTGASDFRDLLSVLVGDRWASFSQIATTPEEISVQRPFYPASSRAGVRQASLLAAHGVEAFDQLRRLCERATALRRAACPVFWTLGGNQVGRGALSGWADIISPMVREGACLWPFEGSLAELAADGSVVLAETYPGEAYGHVGVAFKSSESKRRQSDRASKAGRIFEWADDRHVAIAPPVAADIADGFGGRSNGEDRFDALLGLLGMIEVVAGHRLEATYPTGVSISWEGWILGQ
jgi:hypothetical protein